MPKSILKSKSVGVSPAPAGIPGFPPGFWHVPNAALYLGDAAQCLRAIPARSIHCAVTSPPYWALRNYAICSCRQGRLQHETSTLKGSQCGMPAHFGPPDPNCPKCGGSGELPGMEGQLGSEEVPDCLGWATGQPCGACFVCHMVEVFHELKRVLRDDGTLWLNLGDTYGASNNRNGIGGLDGAGRQPNNRVLCGGTGLDNGNLVGIPWAVAFALRADGWVLRQDIVWHSPNKMPESVTNRCTKSHEYIFLMTKSDDYYYDKYAIEEIASAGNVVKKPSKKYATPAFSDQFTASGNQGRHEGFGGGGLANKRDVWTDEEEGALLEWLCANAPDLAQQFLEEGTNKRDVWVLARVAGYRGAHFATFSPQLITPCILAGTSEHGCCAKCGTPYKRVVQKTRASGRVNGGGASFGKQCKGQAGAGGHPQGLAYNQVVERKTVGWQKMCGCKTDEVVPCVVLDPFVGSGTTVATAIELGRAGVGIDLSKEYLREHAIPRVVASINAAQPLRKTTSLDRGVAPAPVALND